MNLSWMYLFSTFLLFHSTQGALRRCYSCRSRGDLGTCRDPFKYNVTQLEKERGLEAVPCASGWCSKIIEGGSKFSDSDYGAATQRACLQRGPSDNEERCAQTDWNHKKVYLCLCQGDLCNDSAIVLPGAKLLCALLVLVYALF